MDSSDDSERFTGPLTKPGRWVRDPAKNREMGTFSEAADPYSRAFR